MARTNGPIVALLQLIIFIANSENIYCEYFGKYIAKLTELHHGVSGEVYAFDARTLHLKDFTYDGQGPAAYFYAGNSRSPGNGGFRLRDENGSPEVIRRYRKESVTLTLPEGKTLNDIKWFSIWCEEFAVNFGDVKIPRAFDYPRPRKIDALRGVHGISSDNIVIVDAQTLLVPNLSYDGEAPDAKFWVGRGPKPSPQGVRVPDENGKEVPLRKYDRKTIVLTLPGDLTIFDIGHFGIWCEAFTVDFGHIQIPSNLNVPPSLKMLGISPQSKLNCEVLYDDLAFEVRWAVAGDSIVLQLVAKLEDKEYMSFGISGDDTRTSMVGGDVVVAWVDKDTFKGYADDYYLDAKSQCSGPTGSCPDNRFKDDSNSIRLLNAAMVNGYSIVTYQRSLKSTDELDKQMFTNESQPIIWAIGPLNQRNEVSFHSHWPKRDHFIDFGRSPKWNCPMPETEQLPMKVPQRPKHQESEEEEDIEYEEITTPPPPRTKKPQRRRGESSRSTSRPVSNDNVARDSERTISRTRQNTRQEPNTSERNVSSRQVPTPAPVSKRNSWEIPPIQCYEPEDGVFYAQMGPTGGKQGYAAITGHVGWGISWYINGLLIPEVNLVRGKTYTFVIEGGLDPEVPAKYHPFYITDDPIGGYYYKTLEERSKVKIFAGASKDKDGNVQPTGVGRLCHWTHQGDSEADDFQSFGAYQRTLELKCDEGEPGVIQFTPDRDTPDTIYYQCFTHRYLGWKINVLDYCDTEPDGSELEHSVIVPQNTQGISDLVESDDDLEDSPSIRVETRVQAPNVIENEQKKFELKVDASITENVLSKPYTEPPIILNTNEEKINFTENINMEVPTLIMQNSYIQPPFNPPDISSYYQPQINFYAKPLYLQNPEVVFDSYNPLGHSHLNFNNPQQNTFKSNSNMDTHTKVLENNFAGSQIKHITSADITTPSTRISTKITSFGTTEATDIHGQHSNRSTMIFPSRFPYIPFGSGTENVKIIYPKSPLANVVRLKPMNLYQQPPLLPQYPSKKPYYRPISKFPMINRPFPNKFQDKPLHLTPMQSQIRPQPVVIKRPIPQMSLKKSRPSYTFQQKPITKPYLNVEVSPLQASTEKEPLSITEKPYVPIVHNVPSKIRYSNEYNPIRIRPAINTGFHPESVIIEGGFKPIVSKEIQDRVDGVNGPQLEYESEIGIININQNKRKNTQHSIEPFEPVFVPSPLDKPQLHNKTALKQKRRIKKKGNTVMFIIRQGRNENIDAENKEDELAEAAERVDTFYLPPDNKKVKPAIQSMQPSNIDIPLDTVVSYDGRKVSGASLTVKSNDHGTILDNKASKATELVKAGPQFGPFKGELPPLDQEFINKNAPQLNFQKVLNRDLESPDSPLQKSVSRSTKLTLVTEEINSKNERKKRAAHHTPEHTAEQEAQSKLQNENKQEDSKSSSYTIQYSKVTFFITNLIFICMLRYL